MGVQKSRKTASKEEMYEQFSDGWDFSPDAGNSYTRAEVFTPKYAVDMMMSDGGIFCDEAIYGGDYSTLSDGETLSAVQSSVLESAVGTGNFLSEILWHKICYAYELSSRANGHPYDRLVAEAVASVYANDIDAGNLQTAKSRALFGQPVNSEENLQFWIDQVNSNSSDLADSGQTENIHGSLVEADEKWGKFLQNEGVVSRLYRKHTGQAIPDSLKSLLQKIADSNFILFDSITEESVGSVPGWSKILWQIHDITESNGILTSSSKPVAFALQLGAAELEKLKNTRASRELEGASERELKRVDNKIEKLRNKLEALPGADILLP